MPSIALVGFALPATEFIEEDDQLIYLTLTVTVHGGQGKASRRSTHWSKHLLLEYYTSVGIRSHGLLELLFQRPSGIPNSHLTNLFSVDTAQNYRNEPEAGIAIRESGIPREQIFVTTKWSRLNGLDIATSFQNSLENVGFSLSYFSFEMTGIWSLGFHILTSIWFMAPSCAMTYRSAGKKWRR